MGQASSSTTSKHTSTVARDAYEALTQAKKRNSSVHRVAVVGSGCAGLAAAWHMSRCGVSVFLIEKDDRLGGHAHTVNVEGTDVDTGFMVYNEINYPHLCAFFDEIGVEGIDTSMGFSVSMDDGNFEWCADSLTGFFATRMNVANPYFYMMLKDIIRFNMEALRLLDLPTDHSQRADTVREFLVRHKFSNAFRDYYLVPMTAAIWSATHEDMMNFPAFTLFNFLNNHLLLHTSEHITWKTPAQRSKAYVSHVEKEVAKAGKVLLNSVITRIVRKVDYVEVQFQGNRVLSFDEIVFACHPDQVIDLLGDNIYPEEQDLLSCFHYNVNDTYIHCDTNLMPRSAAAWTSWNYIGNSQKTPSSSPTGSSNSPTTTQSTSTSPVFVTYWLNKLQRLPSESPTIFVSLNPMTPPAADKTYSRVQYAHPQFTAASIQAQRGLAQRQGQLRSHFCGAYLGYGFHEDGFRSGIEAAMRITGQAVPWLHRLEEHVTRVRRSEMARSPWEKRSLLSYAIQSPTSWWSDWKQTDENRIVSWLQAVRSSKRLDTVILQWGDAPNSRVDSLDTETASVVPARIVIRIVCRKMWANLLRASPFPTHLLELEREALAQWMHAYLLGVWSVQHTPPVDVSRSPRSEESAATTESTKSAQGEDPRTRLLCEMDRLPADEETSGMCALLTVWHRNSLSLPGGASASKRCALQCTPCSIPIQPVLLTEQVVRSLCGPASRTLSCGEFARPDALADPGWDPLELLSEALLRRMDSLLDWVHVQPGQSLLDLSLDGGRLALHALQRCACRVYSVVSTEEDMEWVLHQARQLGVDSRLEVQVWKDTQPLPWKDKTFEGIVCGERLPLQDQLSPLLGAMEQVLSPAGRLLYCTMTSSGMAFSDLMAYLQVRGLPMYKSAALSSVLAAVEASASLRLVQSTSYGAHYVETLRRWRRLLAVHKPELYAAGWQLESERVWGLWLDVWEAALASGEWNLHVLLLDRREGRIGR